MSFTAKDLSPLVRGDDWTHKIAITSSNLPVDITGCTYWFTLKANKDDLDPGALQVTATPQNTVDAEAGIVYITASKADTGTLEPQTYFYDIQQVDATGNVQTLLIGKVKVVKDITTSY